MHLSVRLLRLLVRDRLLLRLLLERVAHARTSSSQTWARAARRAHGRRDLVPVFLLLVRHRELEEDLVVRRVELGRLLVLVDGAPSTFRPSPPCPPSLARMTASCRLTAAAARAEGERQHARRHHECCPASSSQATFLSRTHGARVPVAKSPLGGERASGPTGQSLPDPLLDRRFRHRRRIPARYVPELAKLARKKRPVEHESRRRENRRTVRAMCPGTIPADKCARRRPQKCARRPVGKSRGARASDRGRSGEAQPPGAKMIG
jgi:hypothetical protein